MGLMVLTKRGRPPRGPTAAAERWDAGGMQSLYEPHGTEAAGGTARILVVDDDPTVAEVVTGYLHRAGYVVDRADDGPTALIRAAAHRPDLVVLDLMLPGM